MKIRKIVIFSGILVLIIAILGIFIFRYFNQHKEIKRFPETLWNEKQVQKLQKTITNPDFCFAVMGDSRDGGAIFDSLLNMIDSDSEIYFSIDVGDITSQGYTYQFRDFLNKIILRQKPLLTVLGNHDIRHNGIKTYNEVFGPAYYDFEVMNVAFIVLDLSEENGNSFTVEQENWLKQTLEKYSMSRMRIVFLHYPIFDPFVFDFDPLRETKMVKDEAVLNSNGLKNKDVAFKIAEILKTGNVNYIFAAHMNAYLESKMGNIPVVVTCGAGAPFKNLYEGSEFNHYVRACLTGNTLEKAVVTVE